MRLLMDEPTVDVLKPKINSKKNRGFKSVEQIKPWPKNRAITEPWKYISRDKHIEKDVKNKIILSINL